MDYNRAQQIIDSSELIQVTYHGIPVYIQSLDSNNIAKVFPLDNMEDLQFVDIDGLLE
ncbi:H-type small acid-soluble spore protein [Oceanobacillus kimchii]|uniref:H-type small acid-soluble spore protein n=1 Tax=Oceanobacillus TaxID=182709 RepID=UPI000346BE52|nr:H-type small acid-soluble spore protein [Oceanobacillus kimchii]MCT1576806.1 H-type small acid-soluble spore protein [Oceanobacillus kimchii]MCT2134876.1 H-type small acid-soluble spore protein [Oceanobacillus kimchii]